MHRLARYAHVLGAGLLAVLVGGSFAAADQYNIAVGKSLTGNLAFIGVPQANAIRMAVDELNAEKFLGEHTLSITVEDDGNDRGQTITLLNKAAADPKTLIYLGSIWGAHAVAVAPLLNDLKIPMFGTAQTTEPLKLSNWYFKSTTSAPKSVTTIAKYAVEKAQIKDLIVVFTRDAENTIVSAGIFRDYAKAHGVNVVSEESILGSDTNFSAVATKIAAANPDAIWVGAFGAQAANLVVQLKRAGVRPDLKIFTTAGLGVDYLQAGGSAVDGTYFWGDFDVQSAEPRIAAFVKNYEAKYGSVPDSWAGVGYTEAMLAAYAIKASLPNPTREKVRDAIAAMKDAPTVLGAGLWSLDADRVPVYQQSIVMVKDGKFQAAP
ncbi:MAG: ABC transporter substrate-binding protein [Rhizobiaceae bacterium]